MAPTPTSRQWDHSRHHWPNRLGEDSANGGRRIHLGETDSVLQLFLNISYWWVKKCPDPETPCIQYSFQSRHLSQLLLTQISGTNWASLDKDIEHPSPSTHVGVLKIWANPPSLTPPSSQITQQTWHKLSMYSQLFTWVRGSAFQFQWPSYLRTVWEYLYRMLLKQTVPVLRVLKLLLSQLALDMGIN